MMMLMALVARITTSEEPVDCKIFQMIIKQFSLSLNYIFVC